MSNELEDFISKNAEAFDDRIPDPAVLQRVQQAMAGQQPAKKGIIIPMRVLRWAVACVILLAGAGLVYFTQNNPPAASTTVTAGTTPTPVKPQAQDAAVPTASEPESTIAPQEPRAQFASTFANRKQAMFAKLNDMASPSTRVLGATEAYKMNNTDRDIVNALVKTMNTDPNTNVRLAALDALTRFHRETYVKQQLVQSLKKQNDPMVQIQLIQLLTRMRETSIVHQLEKMVKDDNTIDAVKDDAYAGILALKS